MLRPDYVQRTRELRDLATQLYAISNQVQRAAATVLEIAKQGRDKELLNEMMAAVSGGRVTAEDILAFYLENNLSVEDTSSVTEGKACPLPYTTEEEHGGNGRQKRVVYTDRPDFDDPAACDD